MKGDGTPGIWQVLNLNNINSHVSYKLTILYNDNEFISDFILKNALLKDTSICFLFPGL